ncbi:MAG: diguanylate cyclase domain-containing protein [Rubrivivax sp.]|jgi:two-component system CheB/CheR fusion protein|nr:diguanylate cyclase [Rubrivivax sp.]
MYLIDTVPCPVLVTDVDGVILAMNGHALQVTGGSAESRVGQPLDRLMPLPSRLFLQTHVWPMLLKDGSVREIYLQLLDADRQLVPALVNCERHRDGGAECWVWVFFVARQRSRFEAELLAARTRADEATAAVAKREHFLKTVTDAVPGLVGYWDRELCCRFANRGYLEWFGRPHGQVIGAELKDLMDERTLRFSQPYIDAVLQGRPQRFERSQPMADGRQTFALVNYMPDIGADGGVLGFFVLVIDITSLKEAEGQLKLAASIVEHTVDAIMVTDEADLILSVNPAFTAVTGYSAAEVVGRHASLLHAGRRDDDLQAERRRALARQGHWKGEAWKRQRDGNVFLVSEDVTAIGAAPGAPGRRVSVFSDVTEHWRNNERLRHLAFHDPLTGLPNRMLLLERLGHLIDQADRESRNAAIAFLDLDRFKWVNDTLGHAMGDLLLKAVAKDLQALVRHSDTVARLGGDEFVVLLDNVAGRDEVETVARRIVAAVGQDRVVDGHAVQVGASLGIAMFPQDGRDREQLMVHADRALYAVKSAARNGYRFFDELSDSRMNGLPVVGSE